MTELLLRDHSADVEVEVLFKLPRDVDHYVRSQLQMMVWELANDVWKFFDEQDYDKRRAAATEERQREL